MSAWLNIFHQLPHIYFSFIDDLLISIQMSQWIRNKDYHKARKQETRLIKKVLAEVGLHD